MENDEQRDIPVVSSAGAPGPLSRLLQELAGTSGEELLEAWKNDLKPGDRVGRFEVVRELGRGSFGVVYEARDRDLGRQVALKVVRPGRVTEEEGKVVREAEAIARLSHPNLVTLHDVGRSDRGPYLVFEFLRGKTLQERMDDGPLPVHEAVHVATEVARGLAHAHAEGVVHRDLKPSNVLVTNKGHVKILDFGMAHAFGRRRLSGGTPAYMAPEQWEDAPEDERTDVFALGVMLYRMLTGEYPFPEGQGRWSAEAATVPRLDVPGAPGVAELVERMLDRTPTRRPRDGAAALAALEPIDDALRAGRAHGSPPVHAVRRRATFADLLAEMRRRRVFRVMIGYAISCFAVLQVVEPIMHGAHLPEWVLTVVLVALALGFVAAVVLAWLYDLTSQGVRRTSSATGPGAPSFGRARLLVPLAMAAGVLVIATVGAGAWYAWKRTADHRPVASSGAAPSVAVLPFRDLSPEHDQEYFSDGMAEEILSKLSRVKGLRVPGRVSSFFFKGKNVEPAEIARKLRVTHLLEGSIRRSGNKLRIRAEVVRASDGETVWNQTFERELTDVLAVQDEIARAAVRELAPMLLAQIPPPSPPAAVDPEAYRLYLLAMSLFAKDSIRPALDALQRSAAIDPAFAPTQAVLAAVSTFAQAGAPRELSQQLARSGREAAERAVALDPSSALGYVSRAWYRARQDWDWQGASDDLDRALAIDPANEWALNTRAILARTLGRASESVEYQRRAVDRDPLNAFTTTNLASLLAADGRLAEARELIRHSLEISPGSKNAARVLGYIALLEGKGEEALGEFERIPEPARSAGIAAALHSLGRERESRDAQVRLERDQPDAPFSIAGVRAWRGDADGAFEALDRAVDAGDPSLTSINASPFLRPIRGDPRWKSLLRRMNLPVD